MKRRFATTLLMLCLVVVAQAQGTGSSGWQLQPPGNSEQNLHDNGLAAPLSSLLPVEPMSFRNPSPLAERPRLRVSLSPTETTTSTRMPTVSWSLEAWEMNTASLAHIQCSRAIRTIESFLVEDCRFVDQPLPNDSSSLVQVQGRWMAAPGLNIGAGAFLGRQSETVGAGTSIGTDALGIDAYASDIQGVNMNVSFGLRLGQVGSLLFDLQLERYRKTPEPFSLNRGRVPTIGGNALGGNALERGGDRIYRNAGQLGFAWRGSQFGADLSGQYQEMPYWTGERLQGEGFRSFDLEFSWRAPTRSSISIGVSNVLDSLPSAAGVADQNIEEAVDGIYGRIPYVRYKHDL